MSVDIGIIGLTQSGKTTIFNALTGVRADTSPVSHIGVTKVPDSRLKVLTDMLHPKKVVPTEVKFIDIGASAKGLVDTRGISGQFLAELSNVDALIAIVHNFTDESIPHPEGSLDVTRDITTLNLELAVSDSAIIERRLKGARTTERPPLLREQEILLKIRADLEKDIPVREQSLSAEDSRILVGYQFLTDKPLLIMVNIGEEQL
ncbi:GTPase, partial [Chloroflexota bacterium]